MAVYYKPQSPIQSGEDFIYPITTDDQVKVDKDTRLNAVGVYLKNIDNSTDTTVYGNNATTLGGVAAEDYALKTDTAPDSSKLGGKVPEYYIQPRNLLDNSDFSNPINQRGISGDYQYFSNAYTIDRWKLDNRTGGQAGIKLSEIGVVISNSSNYSEFTQYVIADTGKQYTLAVGTGDGVKILSGVPSANPESQFLKMKLSTQGYVKCYIIIPSSEITLHWAALYEGSYTADTLPPYVSKGYAAELAECQRYYYQSFSGSSARGWDGAIIREAVSTHRTTDVSFPQAMRIDKPTITLYSPVSGGVDKISEYISDTDVDAKAGYRSRYRFMLVDTTSAFETGKHYCMHYSVSADL